MQQRATNELKEEQRSCHCHSETDATTQPGFLVPTLWRHAGGAVHVLILAWID